MKRFLKIAVVFALMVSMIFAVAACNDTNSKEIESIEITAVPTKTMYNVGDSSDYTGGKITVHKTDGTEEVLDFDAKGVSVSGFDTKNIGPKTITVKYGNKTDTFDIVVVSGNVTVAFADGMLPRTIFVRGQEFDKRDGELVVTENGETKTVAFESTDVTVEGYDKDKVGKQTVFVIYHGGVTTLDVEVHEQVEFEDVQTTYYTGEPFSRVGTVWTTALDGNRSSVAFDDKSVTVSYVGSTDFDSSAVGDVTVNVTVSGDEAVTGKLVVNVIEGSLKEIISPTKTDYTTDDAKIDVTGGFVVLTGADGDHKIALTDDMISGFIRAKDGITMANRNKPVEKSIGVNCGSIKSSFTINMSYGDFSYVKEYADLFQSYYDSSYNQYAIPEDYNDIILECLNILTDENNAYFLDDFTDSELRSIVVSGSFILADIWLDELEQFKDFFTLDLTQGFNYTCETYEKAKAAYELIEQYISYDGSSEEDPFYNLFATEYMLDKLLDSDLTDIVVYDYYSYYGTHDYDVNIDGFFTNYCPYNTMSDMYENTFKGFELAFDIYDKIKDSGITVTNWQDEGKKDVIEGVYNDLIEKVNEGVEDNSTLYLNRAIYNALTGWYSGSGEAFDESKSLFDIIYRVAFENLDLTDDADLLTLAYIASYVQLPHLFEELYNNAYNLSVAENGFSSVGATYQYFIEYNNFQEFLKEFYEEVDGDQFYKQCMENIFIAQGQQAIGVDDFIYNVSSGYIYYTRSSYGDEEFTEFFDNYNQVVYTYLTEFSRIQNDPDVTNEDLTYFIIDGDTYTNTDKFFEDATEVVEGFFDLDTTQQFNFVFALIPNEEIKFSVMAPYYEDGWQNSTPFAILFDAYLRDKLSIDMNMLLTDTSNVVYTTAVRTLEAYELYLRTYMVDGGDIVTDENDESNAQYLMDTLDAIKANYEANKTAVEALVPGLYNEAQEAYTSLKAEDRNYKVENDVQAAYDEFTEMVSLYYTAIVSMGYSYTEYGMPVPMYSAVIAFGNQFLEKLADLEALFATHPLLEKSFYYGVVTYEDADVKWNMHFASDLIKQLYMQLYYGTTVSNGYLSKVATEKFNDFIDKSDNYFIEAFTSIFLVDEDVEDPFAALRTAVPEKEVIDAWKAFIALDTVEQVNYMSLDSAAGMFFVSYIYYFADKLGYDVDIESGVPQGNIMSNFIDVATYYTYWTRAVEIEEEGDRIALSNFLTSLSVYEVDDLKEQYDDAIFELKAGIDSFIANAEDKTAANQAVNYFKTTFADIIRHYIPDGLQ